MALTSRAQRLPSVSKPGSVGPGSYDIGGSIGMPLKSQAPFASTSVRIGRKSRPGADSESVGPGSYDLNVSSIGGASISASTKGSAAFASTAPKLSHSFTSGPGPGQYNLSGTAVDPSRGVKWGAPARATLPRLQEAAPTIPVRSQSYGYTELGSRSLVPAAAPDTGSGSAGPGPGTFNPTLPFEKTRGAVQYRNSSTQRRGPPRATSPGPGAYDPVIPGDLNTRALLEESEAPRPSHFFVSASSRVNYVDKEKKKLPGPGTYALHEYSDFKSGREVAAKRLDAKQGFGSTSKRMASSVMSAAPGPGTYDALGSLAALHDKSMGISIGAGGERFVSDGRVLQHKSVPGPGHYAPDSLADSATSSRRNLRPSRPFLSTSPRFQQPRPETTTPNLAPLGGGLQSDSPAATATGGRAAAPRQRQINTLARAPRTVPPPSTVPPPGAYDVSPQWTSTSFSRTAGRYTASRFSGNARSDAPPPGSYDLAGLNQNSKSVGPSFGSGNRSNAAIRDGPGPGSYNVSGGESLLKRTFNITIGNLWEE